MKAALYFDLMEERSSLFEQNLSANQTNHLNVGEQWLCGVHGHAVLSSCEGWLAIF